MAAGTPHTDHDEHGHDEHGHDEHDAMEADEHGHDEHGDMTSMTNRRQMSRHGHDMTAMEA